MSIDQQTAVPNEVLAVLLEQGFGHGGTEQDVLHRAGVLGSMATELLGGEQYRHFALSHHMLLREVSKTEIGDTLHVAVLDMPDTANGRQERTSVVTSVRSVSGVLRPILTVGLPRDAAQFVETPPRDTKAFFASYGTHQHLPLFGAERDAGLAMYDQAIHKTATWIAAILRSRPA